ncbi:MAG: mechanosensitive ion channel [candidate division Zixibacteria bacterium]|nr:mechanosensitive ion channel [candidate division Zixibacteria bacterium]
MTVPASLSEAFDLLSSVLHYRLFELNQTPVTVSSLLMFIIVLLVFLLISRIVNRIVLRRILNRFAIDDSTSYRMVRIGHYLVMIVGTLFAFQFVGIDLGGLAVIFGLLSVGIGFGLQNITSNFIAGLILLFEQPIRVGDRVTVGGTEGNVMAINMRSTTIRTLNNITIIVPNAEFISERVTNWSHGDSKIRLDIDVGVSYASDLETVLKALREAADEHREALKTPAPDVLLMEFGDSSWNMRLRVWIDSPKRYYLVRSEINQAIVGKFRQYGIEIPFPQRDVHLRSPLPVPLKTNEEIKP